MYEIICICSCFWLNYCTLSHNGRWSRQLASEIVNSCYVQNIWESIEANIFDANQCWQWKFSTGNRPKMLINIEFSQKRNKTTTFYFRTKVTTTFYALSHFFGISFVLVSSIANRGVANKQNECMAINTEINMVDGFRFILFHCYL